MQAAEQKQEVIENVGCSLVLSQLRRVNHIFKTVVGNQGNPVIAHPRPLDDASYETGRCGCRVPRADHEASDRSRHIRNGVEPADDDANSDEVLHDHAPIERDCECVVQKHLPKVGLLLL